MCSGRDKLLDFSEDTFEKCKRMKVFRKEKKIKYGEIDFPNTRDETGYHIGCYRKFVVMKGKYAEEFKMIFHRENASIIITNYFLIDTLAFVTSMVTLHRCKNVSVIIKLARLSFIF